MIRQDASDTENHILILSQELERSAKKNSRLFLLQRKIVRNTRIGISWCFLAEAVWNLPKFLTRTTASTAKTAPIRQLKIINWRPRRLIRIAPKAPEILLKNAPAMSRVAPTTAN